MGKSDQQRIKNLNTPFKKIDTKVIFIRGQDN